MPDTAPNPTCWCHACHEQHLVNGIAYALTRMIVCPQCGNKRCPHAADHRLACTNSNEPGQLLNIPARKPPVPGPASRETQLAARFSEILNVFKGADDLPSYSGQLGFDPDALDQAAELAQCSEQLQALKRELVKARAEVKRLEAALRTANSQAEHFEREWYLRGDEIERLQSGQ